MADYFVGPTGNTPTAPYDTWDKRANDWATIAAAAPAGNRVVADSTFSASVASAYVDFVGTPSAPVTVLSVTPSGGSGFSAITPGAEILSSGAVVIRGCVATSGVFVRTTTASSYTPGIGTNPGDIQYHRNLKVSGGSSSSSSACSIGAGSNTNDRSKTEIDGLIVKPGRSQQSIVTAGRAYLRNVSLDVSSYVPDYIFKPGAGYRGQDLLLVESCDFTNINTTTYLISGIPNGTTVLFRDIKFPTGWTLPYLVPSLTGGSVLRIYNFSIGSTIYRGAVRSIHGLDVDSSSVYKGAEAYSQKITTTPECYYPSSFFESDPIVFNNTTNGSAITVGLDILHDSVTALTDAEVYIKCRYLGTSGSVLTTQITDEPATLATTPASQAASPGGFSWTSGGMANPNLQRASVTFTPQVAGPVIVSLCVAKPSYIVHYSPIPVVS